MGDYVSVETFRAAIGGDGRTAGLPAGWEKRVAEYVSSAHLWSRNEAFHRTRGHTLAVLYKRRQRRLQEVLQALYSAADMAAILARLGLDALVPLPDAYFAAASPVVLFNMHKMGLDIFRRVRRDPCVFLPLWDRSPKRFMVEFSRLWPVESGFRSSINGSPEHFYSIAAANLDPAVFPAPLAFDPARDLGRVLAFNALESEFEGGESPHSARRDDHEPAPPPAHLAPSNSSRGRYCPGRSFTLRQLEPILQPLLDTLRATECAGGVRVMHGVRFKVETVRVRGGAAALEVYKTAGADGQATGGERGSGTLVVGVHGFPSSALVWARLHAALTSARTHDLGGRGAWSTWAVALPGWGAGSRLKTCRLRTASVLLEELVLEARRMGGWDQVLLAGHGIGGMLAWVVAEALPPGTIGGLVSIGAAHPRSHALPFLNGVPVSRVPFRPVLGGLAKAYVAANEFEPLRKMLENETWWTRGWEEEHALQWRKTGAATLDPWSSCVFARMHVCGGWFDMDEDVGGCVRGAETRAAVWGGGCAWY